MSSTARSRGPGSTARSEAFAASTERSYATVGEMMDEEAPNESEDDSDDEKNRPPTEEELMVTKAGS